MIWVRFERGRGVRLSNVLGVLYLRSIFLQTIAFSLTSFLGVILVFVLNSASGSEKTFELG